MKSHLHVERSLEDGVGGKGPQAEEQGIPREDRRDDQARFAEDDQEEHDVGPDAEVLKDLPQVPVEMEEKIDEGDEHVRHRL